jgi:glycosyltransferase involved in cell wall biosynthesis
MTIGAEQGDPDRVSPDMGSLVASARAAGIVRVRSYAWRDLDDPEAGGSEVHADEIFARWADAGIEIVHRTSTHDRRREFVRNHYSVQQAGSRYTVFPRVIAAGAGRSLRGGGSDEAVVEIWNGVPWFSPVWHRGPGVVWLHHVHDQMWRDVLPGPLAPIGRALEMRLAPPWYRRARIATLSESSAVHITGLGFDPGRLSVIPPGVDRRFAPAPQRRSPDPLVVVVARLAPVKRVQRVLEAVELARRAVGPLSIEIIGDGPERQNLQRWIDDRDASAWATLRGRVGDGDLVAAYQRAWLVMSASYAEGWGMSLTEGAACGTPAVATDIAGHRGAVIDGVSGLLVDESTGAGGLAEAVESVLGDRARWSALSAAALEHAKSLSWDEVARRHLEVLVATLPERPQS